MHDDDEDPEYDELPSDAALDGEVEAFCPYCGELVSVGVDAGGGGAQEYVEDCPVCCRPWRVRVTIDRDGHPHVHLEEAQ